MLAVAVYTAVSLAALYHDAVIARASGKTFLQAGSPEAKFTGLQARSREYRTAAYALAVLQAVELVTEIATKHRWGNAARWRVVLMLELAKCVLRAAPPGARTLTAWPNECGGSLVRGVCGRTGCSAASGCCS